jgi:hypothetical protein
MEKTKKSGVGLAEVCVLYDGVNRQESSVLSVRIAVSYLLVVIAISVWKIALYGLRSGF